MEALEFLIRHGYLVLFGVVLGEQLGLPLVGAPVLLAAGALAGIGHFSLPVAVGLPVVACLLGALHMHPEELDHRHGEIARDREIVLYCS